MFLSSSRVRTRATPFEKFSEKLQSLLLYGENGKGKTGFLGILGYLKQAQDDSGSETYRDWLMDFMSATECPSCHGKRLRPESLAVKVNGMSIADFTALPVSRAWASPVARRRARSARSGARREARRQRAAENRRRG